MAENRRSREVKRRLEAMLECAREQGVLLGKEHFGDNPSLHAFQELLTQRQQLAAEIDELQQNQFLDQELQPLLEQIQQCDRQNQGQMHGHCQNVRRDIQKLKAGRQQNQAYTGRRPSAEGAFVDKKK